MYLEDLELGARFEVPEVTIQEEKMRAFAMEYDPFPLHFDKEYAEKTRFGRLVAPGVMTFMTVWAEVMKLGFLGEELIAGKTTAMEWFKPVFAGDRLKSTVTVTALKKRNPYNGVVELTIDIYNQDGQLVLRDVTESVMKCRA